MGFRYRRSIRLGGGFRINISKSGIGYSWGVMGFRVTRTARGTTRKTYSIPGTGISYVQETGKKTGKARRASPPPPRPEASGSCAGGETHLNAQASDLVSEGLEELLALAGRALRLQRLSAVGLILSLLLAFVSPIFLLAAAFFAALLIYVRKKGVVSLQYGVDEGEQNLADARVQPLLNITRCAKVWRVTQSYQVRDRKYHAGAGSSVRRMPCKAASRPPFPFQSNVPAATFKTGRETLVFLPDKLFIIQGTKVGALKYEEVTIATRATRFVEEEAVPGDALVVDTTWQYVNKSGGPDRRFKNNRRLPVCLYGKLQIYSPKGLDTLLMFSNPAVLEESK